MSHSLIPKTFRTLRDLKVTRKLNLSSDKRINQLEKKTVVSTTKDKAKLHHCAGFLKSFVVFWQKQHHVTLLWFRSLWTSSYIIEIIKHIKLRPGTRFIWTDSCRVSLNLADFFVYFFNLFACRKAFPSNPSAYKRNETIYKACVDAQTPKMHWWVNF